jgi:hypothetical protein
VTRRTPAGAVAATYVTRSGRPHDPDDPTTTLVRAELVFRYDACNPDELTALVREQLGPGRCHYVWGGTGWWTTVYLRRPAQRDDWDPDRPTTPVRDPATGGITVDNPRWRRWSVRLRYGDVVTVRGRGDDPAFWPDGGRIEVHRPGTGETFR